MITEFGKIFVFFITAILFVLIVYVVNKLISPSRPTYEKLTTYECGESPKGSPWIKFNIRFYVVALIFLIFDVEVVMILPWAMVYKEYGLIGYAVGAIFLILLGLGMAYEWRKGDLEWARPKPIPPVLNKKTFASEEELSVSEKA